MTISFHLFFQTYPVEFLKAFKVCDDLALCMIQLQYNPKMAVAISREYVSSNRYYNFSYCFSKQEIIHSHTLKFMVRKNFFHLIQLNTFIQMTYTGGLIEKWKSINDAQIHRISSGIEYNPSYI